MLIHLARETAGEYCGQVQDAAAESTGQTVKRRPDLLWHRLLRVMPQQGIMRHTSFQHLDAQCSSCETWR